MGALDPKTLAAWCVEHLGSTPESHLFSSEKISHVAGVRLADGREVVVKVRGAAARLNTCAVLQQLAWQRGFPCPQVLAGPAPFGDGLATAEAYVPGGGALRAPDAPALYARGLAWLVSLFTRDDAAGTLDPAPYWMDWTHSGSTTWPSDPDVDLNATDGPDWLERAGRMARERLLVAHGLPEVIGHSDWENQNLRWKGRELHVVHDWDSLVQRSEAEIAGMSSLMFPSTGTRNEAASIEQSEEFLAAFENARRRFSRDESEVAWAAGIWIGAWKAKKAILFGDRVVARELEPQVDERLRRAGL